MQKKLLLTLIIGLMSQPICAMDNDEEFTESFQKFKDLSVQEVSKMKVIPQWCYSTLEPGQYALVGPLSPCVAVALKNLESNKTIVFHKQFSNHVPHLIDIAKAALEITETTSPNSLRGILYTQKNTHYNRPIDQLKGTSWQKLHNNKSQEEEVLFIKDSIKKSFRIENAKQIKSHILPGFDRGDSFGESRSEKSILVDSDLNVYKVSHEYELHLIKSEDLVTSEHHLHHYSSALSYAEMFNLPLIKEGMFSLTSWASNISSDELSILIRDMPKKTPEEIMNDCLQDHFENSQKELEQNVWYKKLSFNNIYNVTTFMKR